jgi:uncharacterized membrane protein
LYWYQEEHLSSRKSEAMKSHPALRYTLLRLGLFAVVLAVVWGIFYALDFGGNGAGILAVGVALAISGLISYFTLNGERDAMSAALVERVERAKTKIAEENDAEDATESRTA